jgi:SsrA-binding protein
MEKVIKIENKEAQKKYIVEEEYTMGVCLSSNDMKGFKSGKIDISRAWCTINNRELFIVNMRVKGAAVKGADGKFVEPQRKLLEHRDTLDNIIKKVFKQKMVIVPLEVFSNEEGLMKIKVGICTKNPDYVPPVRTERPHNGGFSKGSYNKGGYNKKPYNSGYKGKGQNGGYHKSNGNGQGGNGSGHGGYGHKPGYSQGGYHKSKPYHQEG